MSDTYGSAMKLTKTLRFIRVLLYCLGWWLSSPSSYAYQLANRFGTPGLHKSHPQYLMRRTATRRCVTRRKIPLSLLSQFEPYSIEPSIHL
ncbi:hypothetical protein F4805DRAFT_435814 [Annulohypoxylon moriforme]|nr:hypothetical protein F4805DRAFT_435814 [Annulohypoxylon moriforme]